MLTKDQIEETLCTTYSRDRWKTMLNSLFEQEMIAWELNPDEIKLASQAKAYRAKNLYRLGAIKLADGKTINVYEGEVQNTLIAENRVGLRSLVQNEIIPGFNDAALAVFHSPEQQSWRFTFLSKWEYPEDSGKVVKHETHPKKFTYVLGPAESNRTARDRFYELQAKPGSLQSLIDAFSISKLSKDFFNEYRQHYAGLLDYLKNSTYRKSVFGIAKHRDATENDKAEKPLRDFVKRLMGRIVFLYFLQKKGWMESVWVKTGEILPDTAFMSNLLKHADKKSDFFSVYLLPLFFKTLNKKRANDVFKIEKEVLGKIPYLNGGLFEADFAGIENLHFKNKLFDELFAFFDSYNFTIIEESPDEREVAVDPEMLGHIFENLIEENKRFGTFYTPKEVVHFMTQEALLLHLIKHLKVKTGSEDAGQLKQFIQYKQPNIFATKKAAAIDAALDALKICDPAIGSGAFPMGMLLEIYQLKLQLYAMNNPGTAFVPAEVKETIIRNSIYGVDIDKGAIDIARLRFWLSLIVDLDKPRPLPNFDYKFMQGDSLKEEYEGVSLKFETTAFATKVVKQTDLWGKPVNPQISITEVINSGGFSQVFDVMHLEEKLFNTHDAAEKEKIRKDLLKMETALLKEHLGKKLADAQDTLKNLQLELKNKLKPLTEAQRKQMQASYNRKVNTADTLVEQLLEKTEQLKQLSVYEKPYFLWHLYFKHVFDNGGFDIVIANPPYGVKVDDALYAKSNLASKDSYGFFIKLAINTLLKKDGTLVYVVSDTWLTIKSHLPLRQLVLGNQLHKVIRLHADTFGAVVNTCVFSLSKSTFPAQGGSKIPPSGGGGGLIAADLTNLSTKKNLPEFREKLWHLEDFAGDFNERYAVYQYPQQLINSNSNLPIFAASPKLFALMNDTGCDKGKREFLIKEEANDIEVRRINLNQHQIEIVRFGDVADSPHGISTGNNQKYVRSEAGYDSSYLEIESWMKMTSKEISKLSTNEKINGVDKNWKDFTGCFVPFEKGGISETHDGWLPNYYTPTKYYINWAKGAIKDMKKNLGFRWINTQYFFRPGLTFSISGLYAPTFRLNSEGVFEAKGSGIFSNSFRPNEMLGILCSKLAKFIFKNYIKHTVDTSGEDIANFVFPIEIPKSIIEKVEIIISSQKKDGRYNYFENEQKEIDRLVYELYGLNEEDIQEVEYWWARRYPKLARFADTKPRLSSKDKQERIARLNEIIQRGENKYCEFKSSLRLDVRKGSPEKYIEHAAFKNIAAFLNSEGGTLIIGVDDDKNVLGLEQADYTTFSKPDKQDEWSKHLDNLIQNALGNKLHHYLKTEFIEMEAGKTIAMIEVKPCIEAVWLKTDKGEEFYIRRTASASQLSAREAAEYIREHWR